MRVLIILSNNPGEGLLVKLHTKELINEIKKLINKRKNSHAIATAIAKGQYEKEVKSHEIYDIDADLILTKENVRWDLT